jgi:general stress protein 26
VQDFSGAVALIRPSGRAMLALMKKGDPLQSFLTFLLAVVIASGFAGTAHAAASTRDLSAFQDASYIYIATVRKDGNQSRAARVWFIVTPDNKILIDTNSDSWKAKRIRRGSPVLVWLGSETGPALIGKAEIVQDKAVQDSMIEKIPAKYFLAKIGFFGPKREKFDAGQIVTIRISPVRDLPDGFASSPGMPAPKLDESAPSP